MNSADQRGFVPYLPTLQLFFPDGGRNEYRLRNDHVEFRSNEGCWRALDKSDLEFHYCLDTEVSRWLRRSVLDSNPYLLKRQQ